MSSLDAQLTELADLQNDWDSYGGRPTSLAAIATCRTLHFTPSSDGGIQVELHHGGHRAEIFITHEGDIDYAGWGPE